MKTLRMLGVAGTVVAGLVITACSGGDDDAAPPPTGVAVPVPESAGSSPAAFFSFLTGLSLGDETSEPYLVPDGFAVPADESDDVKKLG